VSQQAVVRVLQIDQAVSVVGLIRWLPRDAPLDLSDLIPNDRGMGV
jgi:hypothetical protein